MPEFNRYYTENGKTVTVYFVVMEEDKFVYHPPNVRCGVGGSGKFMVRAYVVNELAVVKGVCATNRIYSGLFASLGEAVDFVEGLSGERLRNFVFLCKLKL
jgi:hypothetical protein